ncbi:glycosyltransferase family 2 protein [Pseudomonadota bacterium]
MSTHNFLPVSVIIPSFNSENYLKACVSSINRGVCPSEIIIIDDCSTDGSLQVAENLAKKYSNINLIQSSVNVGAAGARQLGIDCCNNDYIALIDADDFVEEGAIQSAYEQLIREKADLSIWKLWQIDGDHRYEHPANPDSLPLTGTQCVYLTLGGWRCHPLGVSKKTLYERAYKGFADDSIHADELITRVVFSLAHKVVGCDKKYFYRVNQTSTTRTLNLRRVSSLRSHIWILDFARRIPNAPLDKLKVDAINEAWFYWKNRDQINDERLALEIRRFVNKILEIRGIWSTFRHFPRQASRILFLYLVTMNAS